MWHPRTLANRTYLFGGCSCRPVAFGNSERLDLFDVPEVVSTNLKDLDIALGQMGEVVTAVLTRTQEVKAGSAEEDREAAAALGRKVEQSWELYVLFEETISAFPTIHRALYYGPFRDPGSSRGPFLESPRGKAFVARTTSVFEAFLVHCESVLDSVLKTIAQKRYNPPSWVRKLSGMGELISLYRRDPRKFGLTEGSMCLAAVQEIAEHFDALDDVRTYRNYVVHHGTIPLHGTVVRTTAGYLDGRVTGSRLHRIPGAQPKLSEDEFTWTEGFDVALFSRYALWRVLTVAEIALSCLLGKAPGSFP